MAESSIVDPPRSTRPTPFPPLRSVPNIRLLCTRSPAVPVRIDSDSGVTDDEDSGIYRSSRPDRITPEDVEEFRNLGIKCIIDFRSKKEYLSWDGRRLMDEEYALFEVILPKDKYKPDEPVEYVPVKQTSNTKPSNKDSKTPSTTTPLVNKPEVKTNIGDTQGGQESAFQKRHFLINFFSFKYIRTVFKRLPWHLWCLGVCHLVWDLIMRNQMKTFQKFFTSKALSRCGLFGQYVDIIEVSQPSICAALKLISDPGNLPVLINCAYGKDRTGIISALVLSCLGMPKEYVAFEYAMSMEGLEEVKQQVFSEMVCQHHMTEEFCYAEPKTMLDLLTYIEERYHSVEEYLISIGFTKAEQLILKTNLAVFDHVLSRDNLF